MPICLPGVKFLGNVVLKDSFLYWNEWKGLLFFIWCVEFFPEMVLFFVHQLYFRCFLCSAGSVPMGERFGARRTCSAPRGQMWPLCDLMWSMCEMWKYELSNTSLQITCVIRGTFADRSSKPRCSYTSLLVARGAFPDYTCIFPDYTWMTRSIFGDHWMTCAAVTDH